MIGQVTAPCLAALWVLAASGAGQGRPRWTGFAGVRLGSSTDDVLALNGDCRPVLEPSAGGQHATPPAQIAQFAFGFSLPHRDTDSVALRAALANATLCRLTVLDGGATTVVVAIDRTVVGTTSWFMPRDSGAAVNVDSVRALVWRAWGRPSSPSALLDSWLSPRYRGYLLVRRQPVAVVEVIMVDVAACTAFDRRVHVASHHGTAEHC